MTRGSIGGLPRSAEHRVVLTHFGQILVQLVDRTETVRATRLANPRRASSGAGGISCQHVSEVCRVEQSVVGGGRQTTVEAGNEQSEGRQNDHQRQRTTIAR